MNDPLERMQILNGFVTPIKSELVVPLFGTVGERSNLMIDNLVIDAANGHMEIVYRGNPWLGTPIELGREYRIEVYLTPMKQK